MTEQTQPTDAELDALCVEIGDYDDPAYFRHMARAVLAKWGTPAGVGEVVAWQSRCRPTWGNNHPWTPWELCTKGQAEDYQKTPLLHGWEYEARALYTTPQPTQAQAGAVPLTDEQIEEIAKQFITRVGSHWEHDDAIPDNGRIEDFVRAIEHAHGIKGADHA